MQASCLVRRSGRRWAAAATLARPAASAIIPPRSALDSPGCACSFGRCASSAAGSSQTPVAPPPAKEVDGEDQLQEGEERGGPDMLHEGKVPKGKEAVAAEMRPAVPGAWYGGDRFVIMFTCSKCGTRTAKTVSKVSQLPANCQPPQSATCSPR